MENQNGNIVFFPKWKANLEKKGLEAFKEKRFQEAVELLEPLVEHKVASENVVTGLVMSWTELGQFDEAEELCRYKMKESLEPAYYHYLHMYITILFQRNRYQEIVDLLDEVFESENIPHQSRTQLWQMYEVSRKLLEDHQREQGAKGKEDFFKALESDDIQNQWRCITQLKKQDPTPYKSEFIVLLTTPGVHPILKTAIIEWLRDFGVNESIRVEKFGKSFEINPNELNQFETDYMLKQIQFRLSHIEQSNPTMYEMITRLLFRYCYVRYPLLPDEEEVAPIVESLKQIGHQYFQLPYEGETSEEVQKYKEEIELCEQHYSLLVGDS
ncbi:tetratricopeptide repeat protein [Halobacillus fulvus]|nr:tetratricopeptide repeat protein [Halobacillus fulvus]